ncbi:GNAT family N-acetyltransferase [Methylobacterium oryzisoli]|uniref:GNAT family N-acetyltransferase n=1 Tax=Methylobacterium oryzisoli TaxID=3385502 RepID=UPI003891ECD2
MNAPVLRLRAASTLRAELLPVAALDPGAWDALAARAAAPSPDYSRRMIEAHRAHGLAPADLACVAVRDGGDLLALLPFRRARLGPWLRVAKPLGSPFITATAPLVADGPAFAPALAALVDGLGRGCGPSGWWWPGLPADEPVGRALREAMRDAGWQLATVSSFERPILDRRPSHDAFLAGHPCKGRLKDLRRRRRRLDEAGQVTVESIGPDGDLAGAVQAFLALERKGWKGRGGTALASRAATTAFAQDLFAPGPRPFAPRADLLRLDGAVIAASLALVGRGTAFLVKTTYDEDHAALAPGALLELEIIRAFHAEGFAGRLDSVTTENRILGDLYPDRTRIAEIAAVPPGGLDPARLTRAIDRYYGFRRLAQRARLALRRVRDRQAP